MENYLLFIIVSIFLILLPGPDMALATRNTLLYGRFVGLSTITGTSTALLIHTIAAALGLSALLVQSTLLFSLFKYIGALYLAYIGIRTLLSLKKQTATQMNGRSMFSKKYLSKKAGYFQGFLTNLTNPKVVVFFLTFLPQFIRPSNHSIAPFFVLGITHIIINLILFSAYVLLIGTFSQWMQKPIVQWIIQSVTGLILIGFGIHLALWAIR
ncbi:LysE family translocator [Sporolactobacillus shoreicorticis]|uniref:LysE family translocator n=1 Tax=Sporolactobacillus shoreicorticis TaxID=1923877 RepID=A0ABW5S694_9BACL|nr:LysE family translocator [Sporolactobacillus shoreicorticis]MCO7127187.1 LysE family translocator [Sporolactobacillus shoreicorticis]